ncbi:hypothetical protein CU098_002588, partial [Rhizopus stolonifer]
ENDFEAWDKVVQWQQDNCPAMIEALSDSAADKIYQNPVYYKRLDADTLHAIVEFAEKDAHHFVVVLTLEEGSGDMSDLKYYNTKELTDEEWRDVFENWSRTIEDAERIFLIKVTRNKRVFTAGTPDSTKGTKEAPEDYWGDWSTDEESSDPNKTKKTKKLIFSMDPKNSDSEDEYYTRWSKDPGTLTPGPEEKEKEEQEKPQGRFLHALQDLNQQELDEEYDQSYNPLFTVPSVPDLMDAHTAALSELTQILQNSIPQQQQSRTASRPFVVHSMTQINPLPKAVSRLKNTMEDLSLSEPQNVPGAYPESGTQSPSQPDLKNKEIGRGLFMKSLSALIGAARLLGYESNDILEMVQEVVNKP